MRKDNDFEITDRINVTISPSDAVASAINSYSDYIKGQVLADTVAVEDNNGPEIDFDDFKLKIKIEKVDK